MASINVIESKDFDVSRLQFDAVTRNKRGGKMIKLSYNNKRGPMYIETPPMYLPFGLSVFSEENNSTGGGNGGSNSSASSGQSMSLDCRIDLDDPQCVQFRDALMQIDRAVLEHCVANDFECFGEKMVREVAQVLQRPCLKAGRPKMDGTSWPPLLKAKISTFTTPVVFEPVAGTVDRDGNQEYNEVPFVFEEKHYARYTCKFILQLQPVWFVNKMFGVSFQVFQMELVDAPILDKRSYMFKKQAAIAPAAGVDVNVRGIKADDDVDEDDF